MQNLSRSNRRSGKLRPEIKSDSGPGDPRMNFWKKVSKFDYNAHPGLRSSDLKLLLRSGLHFKAAVDSKEEKEQTAAQRLGELIHGAVLEPDYFLPRFIVSPDCDKRTTAGKKEYLDFLKTLPVDGIVLTQEEFVKVKTITENVRNHITCSKIFDTGCAEISGFAIDSFGLERKIQPDWRRDDGIIVDLKTTKDASPKGFMRAVIEYKYALQAAYYLETANLIEPNKYYSWLWIAVENEPPYAVAVYQLDESSLLLTQTLMHKALNKYLSFTTNNNWEGYDHFIQSITLPAYSLEI